MKCVVTAGPTIEPLDQVRRLTNFSTGRLGSRLAAFLAERGHQVLLLRSESAASDQSAGTLRTFLSTEDLWTRFEEAKADPPLAIFQAAAVSDYRFGRITNAQGEELRGGKLSTTSGVLQAELVPTRKILPRLRDLFPQALIVGWKYEVDGDRATVLTRCREQLQQCRTNASVANGPAYGLGFGLVTSGGEEHFRDPEELFKTLEELMVLHQKERPGC